MCGRKKTFVTLFPAYKDFHFFKDPGQVPYRFSKLVYFANIVCYNNENDYENTKKYIPIKTISNNRYTRKFSIGIILFLIFNSKKIDILNLFHLKWESLLFGFIYKIFNPSGFVYLKMDNCHSIGSYPWEKIFDKNLLPVSFLATPKDTLTWKIKKFLIKNIFIKKIDLFSVEDAKSKEYYETKYDFFVGKIIVAYNGHTIDLVNKNIKVKSFEEKDNLIITVGRLGTFPKNTLNLLEGFAATANEHNWNLELAGPIAPKFVAEKDNFLKGHPELENRIKFIGNLAKPELFNLYNRAKIFLFPSLFEAFSNVYSEAMYFANAIITSPYTSVNNIITEEKLGLLVEPESPKEIGNAIIKLINHPVKLVQMCNNSRTFAYANLNWDRIVREVENEINIRT